MEVFSTYIPVLAGLSNNTVDCKDANASYNHAKMAVQQQMNHQNYTKIT